MKIRKVLLWAGGILLGLVLVLWLGGWGLLKSPFARTKASEELTKLLGVPVEVDSLDVGGSSTTASIRIPDPGGGPNENLVRIGALDTDITLGGLLGGLTAHLRRDGDGYALDGEIDDPKWGKWKVSGRLTADFTDGQVSLSSERAELHDDLLRTVPYVPREVWDHIGASGQMGAAVAF